MTMTSIHQSVPHHGSGVAVFHCGAINEGPKYRSHYIRVVILFLSGLPKIKLTCFWHSHIHRARGPALNSFIFSGRVFCCHALASYQKHGALNRKPSSLGVFCWGWYPSLGAFYVGRVGFPSEWEVRPEIQASFNKKAPTKGVIDLWTFPFDSLRTDPTKSSLGSTLSLSIHSTVSWQLRNFLVV